MIRILRELTLTFAVWLSVGFVIALYFALLVRVIRFAWELGS